MTAFIIDLYDKYDSNDRAVARYIFTHNDLCWAIKEYEVKDGKLMRPLRVEEDESFNE